MNYEEGAGVEDATALGTRLREVWSSRGLSPREAPGLAGLSFSFGARWKRDVDPLGERTRGTSLGHETEARSVLTTALSRPASPGGRRGLGHGE
jgi:hypothetical protein